MSVKWAAGPPDGRCPTCTSIIVPPKRLNCGSVECKRLYRNTRMRKFWDDYKAKHGVNYRQANPELAARHNAANRARGYTDSERAAYARRRARKKGARSEKVSPIEVFMRDGWVCGICDDLVDPTLTYPDPMSVSLDHVVPLSLGGAHTYANTRCSHLTCNVRRSNRDVA